MSLGTKIAPHLPYLRRFARALAGTQTSGDAYAVAALQSVVEEPGLLNDPEDMRVSLYRLVLRVWATVPSNVTSADGQSGGANSRPRIAFLLTAVEGLTTDEAARVLNCSPTDAAALVAAAHDELATQLATDVLIIEDEAIVAMDLEALVESQGHRVIGIAATHSEAIELASESRPGLVLADIQLADGSSGLDAVNEILEAIDVPVIFITAFPERLLTGERPEPAFLMMKPFAVDALKAMIGQSLFLARSQQIA